MFLILIFLVAIAAFYFIFVVFDKKDCGINNGLGIISVIIFLLSPFVALIVALIMFVFSRIRNKTKATHDKKENTILLLIMGILFLAVSAQGITLLITKLFWGIWGVVPHNITVDYLPACISGFFWIWFLGNEELFQWLFIDWSPLIAWIFMVAICSANAAWGALSLKRRRKIVNTNKRDVVPVTTSDTLSQVGKPVSYCMDENGDKVIVIAAPAPISNGAGTAGFVLSLISYCLFWIADISAVLAFAGLVCSLIGVCKPKKGLAIAGIVICLAAAVAIIQSIYIFGLYELISNDYD